MTRRLLLIILTGLLTSALIGIKDTASQTSSHSPPKKPLPVPITAQESNSFPRSTEIFIVIPDREEFSLHYQDGTKPELVVKTHPTAIGLSGEAAYRTEPYFCEGFSYNMEILHAWGIKNFSQIGGMEIDYNDLSPQERERLLQASCINIEGETIRHHGMGNIFQCTNNPVWREHLLELAKRSISLCEGTDGIYIDEAQGNSDCLGYDYPNTGCFCQYCMEGFQKYLKGKYSVEELRAFGIEDISSFDYGDFIRANYLALFKDRRREVPLFVDFENYMTGSVTKFWREYLSEVKAYAITQGKEVYFSANINQLRSPDLTIAYDLDYLAPEYVYGYPPNSRHIHTYKLGTSLGAPVLTLPTSNHSQTYDIMVRTDATTLWKIFTAEAYSARGFAMVPYGYTIWWTDPQITFYPDLDELSSYYDYIDIKKHLYENLISTARMAVLHSYASGKWMFDSFENNFHGICNLLLDAHFQYDVLFSGDDDLMEDKLTLSALQKYEVVVLPNTRHLSDRQVNLLLSYVNLGGNIIAFGEIGSHSEKGPYTVERPELESLLTEGSHSYGSGKFVYMSSEVGYQYLENRNVSVRLKFAEALKKLIYPNIQTNASENVAMLEYWNNVSQSIVLHVINYDYDLDKQQINSQKNIDLELLLYEPLIGKDLILYYSSPDWKGVERLKYEINGGKVKFTIPRLDFYAVVSIGKSVTMPWIPLLLFNE
jgi:hypothetical protein